MTLIYIRGAFLRLHILNMFVIIILQWFHDSYILSYKLSILEILYLGLLLTLTGSSGGWMQLRVAFEVDGYRTEMWKTGWTDCRESGS